VIVAVLTDFGTRDHYVGTMKAVVLSVCPEARLVDITHDIPPQDIFTGALELAAAAPYFPAGTVFLAVVDPGVGTTRRAIAAEAGGYRFVGPDNGVLSLAFRRAGAGRVVELQEKKFARPVISATFEGRDRFAPAAGWMARGIDLQSMGRTVHDPVLLDLPVAKLTLDQIDGEILLVDRFGNLTSNIDAESVYGLGERVDVASAGHVARLVSTYGDVRQGELCALIGSSGYLEIAVNGGNAAAHLSAGRGTPVVVRRRLGR
jgi:S-adenosylmethionine hydrolase